MQTAKQSLKSSRILDAQYTLRGRGQRWRRGVQQASVIPVVHAEVCFFLSFLSGERATFELNCPLTLGPFLVSIVHRNINSESVRLHCNQLCPCAGSRFERYFKPCEAKSILPGVASIGVPTQTPRREEGIYCKGKNMSRVAGKKG